MPTTYESGKGCLMKFRAVIGVAMAMALTAGATGKEEQPIKIGVLTDMSSLYAAHGGPGSVEAARMAIDDFGGEVELAGRQVE